MKVSINQVKINRVGINTAQVRGIRLSSAVADRGHKVDFPFSDSLVDYWNFKGKNNSDKDRNTIKGVKGNILNAYNFGWSLGSGYGLFKENFNDYVSFDGERGNFTLTDNSIHITEILKPFLKLITQQTIASNSYKVKVSGLTDDIDLVFNGAISLDPIKEVTIKLVNGINDIPVTVAWAGFQTVKFTGKCDITIQQIPEYEGAIVTDGVDDYLKLDKVGYKVGTVIIKHKPVRLTNNWQYVLEAATDRTYITYNSPDGPVITNFDNYNTVGDYEVGIINTPRLIETPLYISCNKSIKEFISMALYSIAIYDRVLSDQEVQEVINFINYGTTNPIFALNFDNFAYKAVDYPDFATGKVTTNKIVVDSTTETFNGAIAVAMNPEADTGEPIEVPSYKIKVTGLNQYSVGEGNWAVGLMGMMIDSTKDPWTYPISKDGVYDIPAISLSDGIYNLGIMAQIAIDKPIEIEVLYDKNVTKSFPENKQIFP
ncbi:hypothetical protein ACIXR3_05645 [Bacteroides fragilis]